MPQFCEQHLTNCGLKPVVSSENDVSGTEPPTQQLDKCEYLLSSSKSLEIDLSSVFTSFGMGAQPKG